MFGNYSKLVGSLTGGILGVLVSRFGLPAEIATPEFQGAVTVILGSAFTFLFPANRPS